MRWKWWGVCAVEILQNLWLEMSIQPEQEPDNSEHVLDKPEQPGTNFICESFISVLKTLLFSIFLSSKFTGSWNETVWDRSRLKV